MYSLQKSVPPRSVLLVEDNGDHAALVQQMLEASADGPTRVVHYSTLADGLNAADGGFDIAFIDLGLPDSTGLETVSRFVEARHELPVVVLTAQDDLQLGLEAIQLGAQDYVAKSELSPALLQKVSQYAVERKRHITQLEKRTFEIQTALRERELLLKEVHHRVKNNLQIICSLLKLQAQNTEVPEVRSLLDESRARVFSMALVHERLYDSDSLALVNLADYVGGIARELLRMFGAENRIELKLTLDEIFLGIDQAIPCGLLINELVTNALKYAFAPEQRGVLAIRLTLSEQTVEVEVSDNGKGLPEGFDPQNQKSLGMNVINTLVAQLQGCLEHESRDGATFRVSFSLPEETLKHSGSKSPNTASGPEPFDGTGRNPQA